MRPLARCVRHRLVVPGIWLMVLARGADGANWWALAIGHARAGTGRPAVTSHAGCPAAAAHAARLCARPPRAGCGWPP